ncbi:MAG: hypothetical protein D3908_08230 [Candidatus Electrothrix sp. AUS4]|nr:hypothetical protein [Candidatus Electrothrix sp. AUS4]
MRGGVASGNAPITQGLGFRSFPIWRKQKKPGIEAGHRMVSSWFPKGGLFFDPRENRRSFWEPFLFKQVGG